MRISAEIFGFQLLFVVLFCFSSAFSVNSLKEKRVTLGVLLPSNPNLDFSIQRVLPVIRLAVKRVHEEENLLRGWNITVLKSNVTDCSATYVPLSAIEMRRDVHVFLGPVCDYDLAPVVRYTNASWNIPILTSGGRVSVFDNKTEYPLLTRMNGYYQELGDVVLEILKQFHWNNIGLLFSDHLVHKIYGRSNCYFAMDPIAQEKKRRNKEQPPYKSFDETVSDVDFRPLLEYMVPRARIILLCGHPKKIRKLMLTAKSMGMLETGEYVFINLELRGSLEKTEKPWADETDLTHNEMAREAFESLMIIRPRMPLTDSYMNFSRQVKDISVREFPEAPYPDEQVKAEAASFYEAVILYVTALNDALIRGHSPRDGRVIHQLMQNRTLPGISGNFSVNANNDRHIDFSFMDMEPTSGIFREVAYVVSASKQFVPVPDAKIHWGGGRIEAPPDEPQCGFTGSKCTSALGTAGIVAIVLSCLLMAVCVLALMMYRHYKKEAELALMTWLVKYDELDFNGSSGMRRTESRQSLLKYSQTRDDCSVDTLALGETRKQIFAQTAYYKKQLCAVKKLKTHHIVLSRPILKEFKTIQGLQHDHIARFIGACFDSDPPCLLFEYCPKGSLEDILENDEIELDWMFKYSLMHDLVKGMTYLHASELKTHGNLKSSNCVVDSRFVLKITDYGPHSMRHLEEYADATDTRTYWKRKLWTAPEILRLPKPPRSGSQKGDVYSFAIIAQEIIYRKGPFYVAGDFLEPHEIIKRVAEGASGSFLRAFTVPYRPTLESDAADEALVATVQKCWSEDPNARPDFNTLRNVIRRLNRENESGNLLDNLLQRMEQYANNLESLVQERTADYLDQKRKAEDLLYQLLPRPVAGQLIKGESVQPAFFDSVTIYFSDIVGFTTISATSTPMQVVNFLNALYTCFDAITTHYDVYKVETIGDAYVVVSGLPVKNGDLHAREIARLSLTIIEAVKVFKIEHKPEEALRIRIGMHTGPVVAGVVGSKMPRYCLFGDTVNTASRMESTSSPMRIHLSASSHDVLQKFGTFQLELRGVVEVKGKGNMITYWLNGEDATNEPLSTQSAALSSGTASTVAVENGFHDDVSPTDLAKLPDVGHSPESPQSPTPPTSSLTVISPSLPPQPLSQKASSHKLNGSYNGVPNGVSNGSPEYIPLNPVIGNGLNGGMNGFHEEDSVRNDVESDPLLLKASAANGGRHSLSNRVSQV